MCNLLLKLQNAMLMPDIWKAIQPGMGFLSALSNQVRVAVRVSFKHLPETPTHLSFSSNSKIKHWEGAVSPQIPHNIVSLSLSLFAEIHFALKFSEQIGQLEKRQNAGSLQNSHSRKGRMGIDVGGREKESSTKLWLSQGDCATVIAVFYMHSNNDPTSW